MDKLIEDLIYNIEYGDITRNQIINKLNYIKEELQDINE